jgi:hypothetical protein
VGVFEDLHVDTDGPLRVLGFRWWLVVTVDAEDGESLAYRLFLEGSCLVKCQSNTLRRVSVCPKNWLANDFAVTVSNLTNVSTTNGMNACATTRNATN